MKNNKSLQTVFLLTDKPIISFNPKELKDHPLSIELFGNLASDEYNTLKNDIKERGIQDALHIVKRNGGYVVISGHQRKKVAIDLGIKVPCIIRDDLKVDWQIEEQLIMDNLLRRHLSDYQRGEIGKRLEPIEKQRAKERLKTSTGGSNPQPKENLPEVDKGQTRDKIAEKLGVSGKQYDKIKIVRDKAPEKIKKEWQQGKITTHQAHSLTTNKGQGMSNHSRKIIFSSKHDDWETPKDLYTQLDKEFKFDFDPCPINPTFNGLESKWEGNIFINPPYSDVAPFLQKGLEELNKKHSDTLVYLIPVRTDTKWFHTYIYPHFKNKKCQIRFIKGRLKFANGTGSKHSAPFPSMLVIFRRHRYESG